MHSIRIEGVVGTLDDPLLERRVHALEHAGRVEYVEVPAADLSRRRMRRRGDRGSDIAIALPRDAVLVDGCVLWLDDERALVLRVQPAEWLRLRPRDVDAALQLGFLAGHLHWRVRFDAGELLVAMDGPREGYLERVFARLPRHAVELLDAG